jgi:sulfite exporter TauE/SafE
MWLFDPPTDRAPSALWLWGFWIYLGAAFAAFVVSGHAPAPVDRVLRCVAGALIFIAGLHQLRVGKYKRATRGPYTVWGFDSFLTDRQTGWSAMIAGVVFIVGALVGL